MIGPLVWELAAGNHNRAHQGLSTFISVTGLAIHTVRERRTEVKRLFDFIVAASLRNISKRFS
jgi:hypothetical protein